MRFLLILITLLPAPAYAEQFFPFTAKEFRERLDTRIREDANDKSQPDYATIKKCKAKNDSFVCDFKDGGFQRSVQAMKKLDLLSGSFQQRLSMTIDTKDNHVSQIRLFGDRGDPANLFTFYGAVMDVFQVFDANIVDNETKLKELSLELGLMRGDSADDIGRVRVAIKAFAAVKCLAAPSSLTTEVVCAWVPRS